VFPLPAIAAALPAGIINPPAPACPAQATRKAAATSEAATRNSCTRDLPTNIV
jgi:hypothetical protein